MNTYSLSAARKQREPSPQPSEYESLVSESEEEETEEEEEEDEEEEKPTPPTPAKKPARKRKQPCKEESKDDTDIVDLTNEVKYPRKTYRLSKKNLMVFGPVNVDACKKTGKNAYTYEGLQFKRIDDEANGNGKKKKKGDDKKPDWNLSMPVMLNAKVQEASTRAMIAAGLKPYTGET